MVAEDELWAPESRSFLTEAHIYRPPVLLGVGNMRVLVNLLEVNNK